MIHGKSEYDIKKQYEELLEDVSDIDAGLVPIPGYLASPFTLEWVDNGKFDPFRKRSAASMARHHEHERKKGVPWTEDEHRYEQKLYLFPFIFDSIIICFLIGYIKSLIHLDFWVSSLWDISIIHVVKK
ncbi:Transcription factor DIVARICATA [Bienertia sinuspersici]